MSNYYDDSKDVYHSEDCFTGPKFDTLNHLILVDQDIKDPESWLQSNSQYCKYCNDIYHAGCAQTVRTLINQGIRGVIMTNKPSEFTDNVIKEIKKECKKISKQYQTTKNNFEAKNLVVKADIISNSVKRCAKLRQQQHSSCFIKKNDESQHRGDETHKKRINKLYHSIEECDNLTKDKIIEYTFINKEQHSRLSQSRDRKLTNYQRKSKKT